MATKTTPHRAATHATSAQCRPSVAQAAIAALLAASALPAHAGTAAGSITFSPADVAAVPALGGPLLVLLAGLLALIAVKAYRRADRGIAPMVAGLLALGSLASAGGGFELITRAQAISEIPERPIEDPAGQTIPLGAGETIILNSAGVPMEATERASESCSFEPSASEIPECREGATVADGERCQVNILCPG